MGKLKDKKTDNDVKVDTLYGIETKVPTTKMVVSKTQEIVGLPKEKLTLMELKLFDIYLGRINPMDPDITKVVFTKDELCKVIGTDRIDNTYLMKCLDKLMTTVVTVASSGNGKSKIEKFTLLSHATLNYDNEYFQGLGTVELECTKAAKKYIYNIETVGFLKTNLATLLSFESKSTYALYQYLRQVEARRSRSSNPDISQNMRWTVDVDQLKIYLGVADKYKDVKDLDRWVLMPALKEIEEKTDLRFTYNRIRVGRKIQKIEFQILNYGYEAALDYMKQDALPEVDCRIMPNDDDMIPFN